MANESECVLVIEDQTNVREAVLTVLNDSGYMALGGDTAMALVKQAAESDAWPRAVICDYRLGPSYSGFDAIAELHHEFGDEMPAILVTGDLDPLIQARAAEQGIRVMHKPLDRDQLLTALREITRPPQG